MAPLPSAAAAAAALASLTPGGVSLSVSYGLSFNNSATLSLADAVALVREAAQMPLQIAGVGESLVRHPLPSLPLPSPPHPATAAAPHSPQWHDGGSSSSSGGGAAAVRVTRWSPLCVSLCALGTPPPPRPSAAQAAAVRALAQVSSRSLPQGACSCPRTRELPSLSRRRCLATGRRWVAPALLSSR